MSNLKAGRGSSVTRFVLGIFMLLTACTANASVLVWSSGNGGTTAGVASWIQAMGGFGTVDWYDGDTRSFAQLDAYDRVLYFSNSSTSGNIARGDVLADFADTGKRLVLSTFSWADQGGNTLEGRIVSDALSPFSYEGGSLYSNVTMTSNDGSAFFTGVNTLSGYYHDNVGLTASAVSLASWSDGESLLAIKGNVVGVNLFPDDSYGQVSGDNRQLFVNALGASVTAPEPASIALLGLGLIGLGFKRRQQL